MTELQSALISSGQAEDLNEALNIIECMKAAIADGEDPEDVLFEYGLEPDYVFDLI